MTVMRNWVLTLIRALKMSFSRMNSRKESLRKMRLAKEGAEGREGGEEKAKKRRRRKGRVLRRSNRNY